MAANPYELTTREVLSILFKEWAKLAIVFAALCLLVVGYFFMLTPYFQATTRLLVKSGREFEVHSEPGRPVASVPYVTKQEVINSEIQILTSRDLVEAVINQVGADRLYPGSGGWFTSKSSQMDKAIQKFYRDYHAAPVELADVIEVTYRNPNPALAVQTLNAVVSAYVKKHAQMFSDPRYKFLEQETQQYQTQLDAVTRKITDLRNSKSLFDIPTQRAKLLDDRAAISTILQQLRSQSVDAHQRADFLKGQLKLTPQMVAGGASQSDAIEQARNRLLDTEVKAEQLRQRYVGDVKPLQDAEQQIAQLRQFIAGSGVGSKTWSQRNPAYDDMVVALNRAQADAAPLDQQITLRTQQLADLDTQLRGLDDGAKAIDDAERERQTLEELVHNYRTQYEQARLNENLDRSDVVSVSVVQQPSVPTEKSGPHFFPLFAIAAIVIGLIGASGVMIYLLVFRETLITVESVERIIGVPVLASVPNSRAAGNDNRRQAA